MLMVIMYCFNICFPIDVLFCFLWLQQVMTAIRNHELLND